MKAQPTETAPPGRFVLVKHIAYGWIEAMFDPEVYAQSIELHGEKGGFGWSNPGFGEWFYHKDITAWAPRPEEE